MTVIERWECPEHGADSGPGKRCGRMAQPYVLCRRDKVKVEYVPAEQLQGAVEALRWVADRYAKTLAGKSVRDADEALERARLIVEGR